MSAVIRPADNAEPGPVQASLAIRIADACVSQRSTDLSVEVIEKVKTCLFDFVGCAIESRDLPWSVQAGATAQSVAAESGGASIIGTSTMSSHADAAFVNAVMGHGLVREDMHSGSVSHLGIVVLPTTLALSQYRQVNGRQFCAAVIAGYEVGARVGRAAITPEIARIRRPTGISGPIGAAAAGACVLGLDREATVSAIALGTNTTLGFNQWALTGGSEMFFQAGFAARNALTAARLAEAGAYASPSCLDGEAGLFASLDKRSAASSVTVFDGEPEIMSVYHKPVPACNFAQTPSQAALAVVRRSSLSPERIVSIRIRVPRAGMLYPGCNHCGPFAHILQAKMSIQYNVAAALLTGDMSESNFSLLDDPSLRRLIGMIRLEVDDEMTQAYPGQQGGEVEVEDIDGKTHRVRLADVVNASASDVRDRFRREAAKAFGDEHAMKIEAFIDDIDNADNAGRLNELLGVAARKRDQ
ncbi:MAG TPA: MmgE/PrpD family protein [Burkholderiales bacterium]|nr:MmgE/PrpD family protein [Burkholderiales bacterium]